MALSFGDHKVDSATSSFQFPNTLLDTVFTLFKGQFPQSLYTKNISIKYNQLLALSMGKPAPEIIGTNRRGEPVSISNFKGKVIFIDIWASWCAPCLDEMPYSINLENKFKGNEQIVFLYISIDRDRTKWKKVVESEFFSTGVHLILDNLAESKKFFKNYQIGLIPRYVLIDKAGNIANINAPRSSSDKINGEIQQLLNK